MSPEHFEPVDISKAIVQPLASFVPAANGIEVAVLRLDLVHPVIAGNKWFKLKYHLLQARQTGRQGLLTFGGAYSNHLVATAFAARQAALHSIGIVRGEVAGHPSPTLQEAESYGMQLQFVPRTAFNDLQALEQHYATAYPDHYVVPQGGQSEWGIAGAAEILQLQSFTQYSHIACAAGTGTMLAGLLKGAAPHQQLVGISSLKVADTCHNELHNFVQQTDKHFTIFYGYHFGGYARKNNELLQFMNQLYRQHQLPTDFVYTGKLFYAVADLLSHHYFSAGSRLLVVHSGGLQGNRSLPPGTLCF